MLLVGSRVAATGLRTPVLRLTQGFLRSPTPRGRAIRYSSATLSEGGRSWAERIRARDHWFTPALARRAEAVLSRLRTERIGGTWWAPAPRVATEGRAVVWVDRAADAADRLRMAMVEFGPANVVIVTRRVDALARAASRQGATVLPAPLDPWALLDGAAALYASSDCEAAVVAGLLGTPIRGSAPVIDAEWVASTLLLGTRYVDPFTGLASSCEAYLEVNAALRRLHDDRDGVACCVGISFWKRQRVKAMLDGAHPPRFRKTAASAIRVAAKRGGSIAVWASREPATLRQAAAAAGIPVARLEDGFVRSVGLGADFRPPLSLVLDRTGLYYDATGPSDLETLLQTAAFEPALIARAAALRRRIVRDRVTKYNLGSSGAPVFPAGRRIVLVPGQVADDRSVALGGAGVAPGLDLLRRVRIQAPDAYVVYKPHPDVEAGHRVGAVPDADVLRWADQIVRDAAMADLLPQVDEVHTLTSLTGFEALLRGKPVTTYGQPFYAGWGLTTDLHPPSRRTRRLGLDELVAATLILYPLYIDPVTSLPCGPEVVLDRLQDPALHRQTLLIRLRRAQSRWCDRLRRRRGHRSGRPGSHAV